MMRWIHVPIALTLSACVAEVSVLEPVADEQPTGEPKASLAPMRIGDLVDVRLAPPVLGPNGSHDIDVVEPGATFVKLHFAAVELVAGDELVITDEQGNVIDRLTESRTSWWALSVDADRLRVTLRTGAALGSRTFLVDRLGIGTVDVTEEGGRPRAICGADDKRPAACFSGDVADKSRAVGRMRFASGGGMAVCTGALVSAEGHFLTNNHCISSQADTSSLEVRFNYQAAGCTDGAAAPATVVSGGTFIKTSGPLDYTLVKLSTNAATSFGFLEIDASDSIAVGTPIYIPQHPGGRLKEIATTDGQTGGNCTVRAINRSVGGYAPGANMGYTCDTEGGSSGSPVLHAGSHKLVALHHLGGCNNSGTYMRNIYPEISQYLGGGEPPPPPPPDVTELDNGVGVALSGQQGNERMFVFDVPANATNVSFRISGGTGDADIYVKFGAQPTRTAGGWDHRPYLDGNNETVNTAARTGKWYVMVHAYASYANTTLVATYTTGGGNPTPGNVLTNGVPVTGLSGARASEVTYRLDVPAGTTSLRFSISGGTGDADLYVRKGAPPTRTTYDYRPYLDGNSETVTATPSAGSWYVMIRGYASYSGVTLVGTAQ